MTAKCGSEEFDLWINVGVSKYDGKNHIYSITNKKEDFDFQNLPFYLFLSISVVIFGILSGFCILFISIPDAVPITIPATTPDIISTGK